LYGNRPGDGDGESIASGPDDESIERYTILFRSYGEFDECGCELGQYVEVVRH
jgi:hypothetical protein